MESLGLPVISAVGQGLDVSDREIDELFPAVDCEFKPFGHRVVVQMRRAVNKSKGGIILTGETVENEKYNGQVCKLIAAGPLAFKNRATAEAWPEGVWAKVGDYVKAPRWGGDRFTVETDDGLGPVSLAVLADSDLIGSYTGDVRKVRAHLA